MIQYNNKELRNLEEQVLKNKEDIANHYAIDRTLANFGIKIVGRVETVADLPDAAAYPGEYGDGYAVGTIVAGEEPDYTYYIFTRPDPNSGHPTSYWLDVGQLAIRGPQGPQGEQGPQGPTGESTRWYTQVYPQDPKVGDMYLADSGEVFQYMPTQNWLPITSIRGPQGLRGLQGIQGPQGEQGPRGEKGQTGDVGGIVNIRGIVANTAQLPTPAALNNLSVAYLVGAAAPYTLYIQVGENSDSALWTDVGAFNAATLVTVNGAGQNVWNADTKLDKKPDGTVKSACYGTDYQGNNKMRGIAEGVGQAYNGALAMYVTPTTDWGKIPGGALWTATPQYDGQAANKKYVDTNTASTAKLNSISSDMNRVFGITNDGSIYNWYIGGIQGQQFSRNSFATYWINDEVPSNIISLLNSRLFTGDPNHDYHAAPKKYVDTKTKRYQTFVNFVSMYTGNSIRTAFPTHGAINDTNDEGTISIEEFITDYFTIMPAETLKFQNIIDESEVRAGVIADVAVDRNTNTITIIYLTSGKLHTVVINEENGYRVDVYSIAVT